MTATRNVHRCRMKELYEAFDRGDIPTVLAAMDEGVEWYVEWYEAEGNPWSLGRPFVGPQEVVEGVFQRLGTEFDGFEVHRTRFLGDGDTVIMEGRYRARSHKATGKPLDAKPLDAEVVHVWDLRNGKVVRFHQYVDTPPVGRRAGGRRVAELPELGPRLPGPHRSRVAGRCRLCRHLGAC